MARDLLIREITYRMSYRGTLELDTICRAVLPRVATLDDEKLEALRELMLEREGDLMLWLVEGGAVPAARREMVKWMRDIFKEHYVTG